MTTYRPLTALSLLFFLGFIWGTGYFIARFAMTHGIPPLGYSFWQALGPAILLCLISRFKGIANNRLTLPLFKYYLICGLSGIVIPNTVMYFAAAHLTTGLLAVVVNTVPIIVYPLALITRTESFDKQRLAGVLCAFLGLMLLVLPKSNLPSPDMIAWIFCVLITPFSFAFCSIYIARFQPDNKDSVQLAEGTLWTASLLLLPLVLFSHSFYYFHFPFSLSDKIIFLEIILSSIGYILFFQLIRSAGVVYYSLVDTIVSLTGLFWGFLFFHEKLTTISTFAIGLILLALILVNDRQKKGFFYVKKLFT